jgi:hypothetical protein
MSVSVAGAVYARGAVYAGGVLLIWCVYWSHLRRIYLSTIGGVSISQLSNQIVDCCEGIAELPRLSKIGEHE